MDRRNFLSLASFAGLSVTAFDALGRPALPGLTPPSQAPRGPLFITVNAAGGWDPTSLCDPKGAASDVDTDAMNWSFRARDIGSTPSGIRYAPLGSEARPNLFQEFFERNDRRLLVINGVDVGTRGHDDGARHLWSGRLGEGYPSFAALVAASRGRDESLAYLSFGGYDETQGEAPRGRDHRPAARFAGPDEHAPVYGSTSGGALFASRSGADELRALERHLPELDRGDNPLIRQIQVAMAAHRAGITVAVNLELDGFDTHQDHDAQHIPRLCQLLEGLEFIDKEAERQGLGDDYVVVVGSEFGRSPGYNDANGKDHWPVTSVMAMGKGVTGGRVLGATTERHAARPVDPRTLAPDERGVHIEPRHIHHDLRRLAGLDADPRLQLYPLAITDRDDLRLFT